MDGGVQYSYSSNDFLNNNEDNNEDDNEDDNENDKVAVPCPASPSLWCWWTKLRQ